MSVLSTAMRRSVASVAGTQLLPGTRFRFKDAEAPLPSAKRLTGGVVGLHLYFDGAELSLDAVGVRWDDPSLLPDVFGESARAEEVFQKNELGQLEILP